MERAEAVAIVKELFSQYLTEPSFIALKRNGEDKFDIMLKKSECDIQNLKEWASQKKLTIEEDASQDLCIIHKARALSS